jgi:hypothetical protein
MRVVGLFVYYFLNKNGKYLHKSVKIRMISLELGGYHLCIFLKRKSDKYE